MATNKTSGIYKITSPTGKVYIGQAVNIKRRWAGYNYPSSSKKQPKLKASFKKYGVDNHQFDIIEYCSEEELNCSERFWQDEFDVTGKNGLNCVLQECGEKRKVLSDDAREKLSKDRMGDKNPNWGKPMSQEAKDKRNLNRKCTKGIPKSEETKRKFRENHADFSGDKNPKAKITLNLQTGIYYSCAKDACKTTNFTYDYFKSMLNGASKNKTDFIYV